MHRHRRATPRWLAAGLLAASAALTVHAAEAPAVAPIELAAGVYMLPGAKGEPDATNLGRVGNAGFIVGRSGVLAIDTGTSYLHGRALLAAIGSVTDKPVRLALVTHTRPEFLFGGAAFRERGIPVRMHSRTATLMASRCETCLKTLRQVVGDTPMLGTAMYRPDQQFDADEELTLIGRPVRALYFGHSSGPGDIAVLDVRSNVLFAGGLLDAQRVPDIQDGTLPGWRQALAALRALRVSTVVPGHGPATSSDVIGSVERYLDQLETRVRAVVAAGESLIDVADASELSEFATWDQYETIHRRNASVAYLRFERELMFK